MHYHLDKSPVILSDAGPLFNVHVGLPEPSDTHTMHIHATYIL